MKRFLALFLTLLLLVPCLTVSASASTQGVIDAIEDLQAGLGTSQRDILDAIYEMWDGLSTDLWNVIDSIDDNFVDLFDTHLPGISNILNNIHSKLTSLDTYFFTKTSKTVYLPYKVSSLTPDGEVFTWEYVPKKLMLTGFEYSLFAPIEQISQWFVDIANAIIGDTTKSDQFDEDKAPVETQVDEWLDDLATAPTLNVDEIEVIFEGELGLDPGYMGVIQSLFSFEVFILPVFMAFIFASAGYLLYGKR